MTWIHSLIHCRCGKINTSELFAEIKGCGVLHGCGFTCTMFILTRPLVDVLIALKAPGYERERDSVSTKSQITFWKQQWIVIILTIAVIVNLVEGFILVLSFFTYWTCSPGGRCRWGSRRSRCRSFCQQTSGRSAAGACCSAECLHGNKAALLAFRPKKNEIPTHWALLKTNDHQFY